MPREKGDLFGCFGIGDRKIESALSEPLGVLAQGVSGRRHRHAAGHHVAPLKFCPPGVIPNPRYPVTPYFERRRVCVIQISNLQYSDFRNTLTEVGRDIPAASPSAKQLRGGKVVAHIVVAGQVDSIALSFEDDAIGAQMRFLLNDTLQPCFEFRLCLQCLLTDHEEWRVTGQRGCNGLGSARDARFGAAHHPDIFRQIVYCQFFKLAGLR
jgi:hypothetical protein